MTGPLKGGGRRLCWLASPQVNFINGWWQEPNINWLLHTSEKKNTADFDISTLIPILGSLTS